MTEMARTLVASAHAQLADDTKIFGFTKAEIMFIGLMLGGLATALTGLDTWTDLERPQVLVGILFQLGGAAVAFAAGRASVPSGDTTHV